MPLEDSQHAKLAETDYDIHELLRRRWSPRSFEDRPVSPDTLLRLCEAFRWAPSSANEQPWHLVVAPRSEADDFARLVGCLNDSNAVWARHAPVLALSVAKLFFERTGRPNHYALHDVGLATMSLVVQATALGLSVHQMAGFDHARAREAVGIPEGHDPVAMIALGYPGPPEQLDERLRERELAPRVRKPVDAFVFGGRWGVELGNW